MQAPVTLLLGHATEFKRGVADWHRISGFRVYGIAVDSELCPHHYIFFEKLSN